MNRFSIPSNQVFSAGAVLAGLICLGMVSACAGPVPVTDTPTAIPATIAPSPTPAVNPCSVVSVTSTPGAVQPSIFPPVSEQDWIFGPDDAEVTLLMYSDFQCPYCAELGLVAEELAREFPQDLRLVFRHFPLNQHDKAGLAAQAAEAAGLQGKFWEMHDLLYQNQETWGSLTSPISEEAFIQWLIEQAPGIGLDPDRFSGDLASPVVAGRVATAKASGADIGIPGTPFILVNGEYWPGPNDIANLRNLVRSTLLASRQVTGCPPMAIDPNKQYLATLKTEKGDIVIQLYPDKAPFTVNSFIFLARQGWYNGVTFHYVSDNPAVAQTGDPSATGWGGPGYTFLDEISPDLAFDRPGVVAMANMGPDTNGSQFFITRSAIPSLDGRYPIFGQVIEGLQIVDQLTLRDPSLTGAQTAEAQPDGDKILEVTILEK